jgi:hypothetical protein
MQSHEVRPGIVMRVHNSHRKPEFEGMLGIIKNCFGDSRHPVVDVQLEDGRQEMFWFHQVEKVGPRSNALRA